MTELMPNSWTKSTLYFIKLSQPLTVSKVYLLYAVKEKGGNPNRKPYHFLYGLRNPFSRLYLETSTKLYIHEFGFRVNIKKHLRLSTSNSKLLSQELLSRGTYHAMCGLDMRIN
jgi:hypothetical protein